MIQFLNEHLTHCLALLLLRVKKQKTPERAGSINTFVHVMNMPLQLFDLLIDIYLFIVTLTDSLSRKTVLRF